jgi:hypothetical protein
VAVLLGWNFYQNRRINQLLSRSQEIYGSAEKANLDKIIEDIRKHLQKSDQDINEAQDIIAKIYDLVNHSLQKVGVIRFNPFGDVGGDQSFSIALLDRRDNGLAISSLYSREGTRVYTKPIKKGQSDYPLSEEEKKALERARTNSNN